MSPSTLSEWARAIFKQAGDRGLHEGPPDIRDHVVHLHEEVAELGRAARAGTLAEPCDKAAAMRDRGLPVLSCLAEELADVVILALGTAERFGVDIEAAIQAKHAYNRTRPRRRGWCK
jgi:NTP pyrophosphatase (non-canonical NTP hydrolase)